MTPEGRVEAHLKKRVKETGGEIRKLKWIGRNGAPDRVVWWPPRIILLGPNFAFIEVKRPGEKPTPQQEREHMRLRDAGFRVLVVDSEARVDAVISLLTNSG